MLIYSYGDFIKINESSINPIARDVLSFLKSFIASSWSPYTKDFQQIEITSMMRSNDNITSPHYKNMAVDITTKPAFMMPYLAGVLHRFFKYNIYLGTYTFKNNHKQRNRHIHIDADYEKHTDVIGYEFISSTKVGKKYVYSIGIGDFNNRIIDSILKLYGYGLLNTYMNSVRRGKWFGNFEDETKDMLITPRPIKDSLSVMDKENEPWTLFQKIQAGVIGVIGLYIVLKATNRGGTVNYVESKSNQPKRG